MGLNAKQKQAVEYLDGPLLVLAGPGTGKTQLLSEKVAYILKNTDMAPENILCITFTENGAKNMRERLKKIVGKDGLKVNVSTYHAFGSEILAQYKNYSDEYTRKIDSPIDEVTQFKVVKEIRDKLPGTDILHGDNIKDIIEVISAAKGANLSAEDLNKIAEINIEDSRVLSEAISPLLLNVVPRDFEKSFENAYRPIYEILRNYAEAAPEISLGEYKTPVHRNIALIAKDMKDAILEAESAHKITPLSKWRDGYFEKSEKGTYRLKDRVANKKLLSIAKVMTRYEERLREEGLFDYDDMIQEAVRVLKADQGFKLTLAERYQVIMLDEFQDTNPSQLAIIESITDYDKPMIMAVGDDDQAIFEFQGALSSNFASFQEHYNAEVIALTENYRSTQEILDFSHKIIMEAPDRYADKELIAHKEPLKSTGILRAEFLSSDMEYSYVADEIARLIKSGVKQNEIAVISQKRKYFEPLLPFLSEHKEIKIAYEKQNDLMGDERMHQIFTIARYIYECANEKRVDVSLLEILSYPFFKLPILEIIKLSGVAKYDKRSAFEVFSDSGNEDIKTVMTFFANLIAKSFNEPLEIFLDYLVGAMPLEGYKSPFLEYYAKEKDYATFTLYEDLAALRGRLSKHFGEKNLRLSDLIMMLDDYAEAEMGLNVVSPYKEAEEAVQILTAHGSKGLEFEHVFIISADHIAWGKGKGNNNLLSLPKNLTHIRHTGVTDSERLRVLYVALTRAKSHLYITNSKHDFNEKSPERLEYFEEYEEDGAIISPLIPSGRVEIHYDLSAPEIAAKNVRNWFLPYVNASPDLMAIYKERVANYRMSASSLTSFVDICYAGPEKFFEERILMAPKEAPTEAMIFGILVHATFEKVTNEGISDEEAVEFFLSELEKQDLSVETKSKLREKGPADLVISLKTFANILRDGEAEVNLGSDKLVINGVPVTGKVDHIRIDEENKEIEIYDFKTSGYHKEKWTSHATLYKYMLQLGFYKLLLNNSPKYSKYKISKAHILFVVPDKDDEVHDKVYEFNSADEKELLELMAAVYYQISSLDFLKDADLMLSPDSTKGIKDIKKFIELLLAKNQEK
ncbi:ATP-dependent helicase [Candidatus Saccharibacteria bacterium]|nr:ATP-dependent helicase [Candidatus Saccharibacteria bacterium]